MNAKNANASTSRPRLNPAIIPILLTQLIGAMGYGIVFPLLPYYATEYGATPIINGMLGSVYALCALVAGPILGQLSDRHGRRPWLLFSLVGTFIGFIFLGIGGSLAFLFIGRIIDGISGGNIVIAQAYVSDVTKPEERTQTFGLMGASFGVGFVLGPILGSLLSPLGLSAPMWAAAALSLVGIVVTFFMLPESVKKSDEPPQNRSVLGQFAAIGEVFTRANLRPLLVLFACAVTAFSLFVTTLGQFMHLQVQAPASQAGWPAIAFGLCNIFFQIVALRPAIKAFGERALIPVGMLAIACSTAALFFVTTMLGTLVIAPFLALGLTFIRPSITSLITHLTNPREVGKVLGVTNSLDSLAQMLSPLVGGFLIDRFTPGTPGLLGAALALTGLAVFFGVRGQLPARAATKPQSQPQAQAQAV